MRYTLAIVILFLLLFPVYIVIGILIVTTSGFPIMYRQQRVGKSGKRFMMYKFRTMTNGAQLEQKKYLKMNESKGPVFKIHNDPRFTGIGKFLSHTGLDELPQLYNVIRGEMAFIGPRPLPVSEVKALKPWMHARHAILPGIISPAILTGKYHKNFTRWMKSDVEYAQTKNLKTDMLLLLRSLRFLIRLLIAEIIK